MAQLKTQLRKNRILLTVCALGVTAAFILSYVIRSQMSFTVDVPLSKEASTMDAADARSDAETNEAKGSSTDVLIVHIDGAVASPGVYELDKDARVQDAVVAAGGFSDSADTTALNLAAKLSDGQKIHIPDEGEVQTAQSLQSGSSTESYVSGTNDLININSASIDELDSLPGVGPSTAAAIVSDREKLGSFSSIEDLMRVSGIGEKKFEKLKDYICV